MSFHQQTFSCLMSGGFNLSSDNPRTYTYYTNAQWRSGLGSGLSLFGPTAVVRAP